MKRLLHTSLLAWMCGSIVAHAEVDSRAWQELDLVPMPKEIRLTDEWVEMDPQKVALLVGSKATETSRRGAEWINRRIEALGGKPLPIFEEGAPEAAGRTLVVIGTRSDNSLIEAAAARGDLQVAKGKPGLAGYQITRSGQELRLAGADEQGVLYACITLGELLEPGPMPRARICEVRDWPDFHNLTLMPGAKGTSRFAAAVALRRALADKSASPQLREACLAEFRQTLEYMLRRKMPTYFVQSQSVGGERGLFAMHPYARETLRLCLEMGREWGVRSFYYSAEPFVGLQAELPNVDPALLVQDSYQRSGRYKDWVRSWSMDEERRQHARRLAKVVREIGFDIFGFHDTDNGLPENPAQWDFRGDADRKRWGDDYGAATINAHRIYLEELLRENPRMEIHFTLMPYNIRIFGNQPPLMPGWTAQSVNALREKTFTLWRRFDEAFPKEIVSFCIREASPDAARNFRENMPGRPLLLWWGMGGTTFFNNSPAWLGTFFTGNPGDIVFTGQDYIGHGTVPLLNFAMREYSWNKAAPGSAPFPPGYDVLNEARNQTDTDTFRVVLPRLVRNYFGREISPEVMVAMEQNISPYVIFSRRKKPGMDDRTETRMASERSRAEAGAEALDRAWQKALEQPGALQGCDPYVLASLAFLRETYHASRWVAAVKEQLYKAERLLAAARYPEALAALSEGGELIKQAEPKLKAVAAQKPPQLAIPKLFAIQSALEEELNAAMTGLFASMRERILQQAKSGKIPAREFKAIRSKNQTVPVVTLPAAPVLDGEVSPTEWAGAWPVGAMFEGEKGITPARAPAEFRVAQHGEALYVAFKAPYLPGEAEGASARSRELIRLYLRKGGEEAPVQAIEMFERGLVYAMPPSFANEVKYQIRQGQDAWEGELYIPTGQALGAGGEPWRIFLVRGYGGEAFGGVSALLPLGPEMAGSFRNLLPRANTFPIAKPEEKLFTAQAGRLALEEAELETQTLDDGIFSVLRFKVRIVADQMLEQAVLEADLKDEDGRSLATGRFLEGASIPYATETGVLELISQKPITEGVLSLRLKTSHGDTRQTFQLRKQGTQTEATLLNEAGREAASR